MKGGIGMKKLGKRLNREQSSFQLYSACYCGTCSCSGCSGTPSWNYVTTRDSNTAGKFVRNEQQV